METKQEILDKKERKKTASCEGKHVFFNVFLWQNSFLFFFIFNHPPYFSTFPIWSLVQKGFKLACNWSSIFKHLAIVSLQTRAKILLAAGIPAFTLDFKQEYLELLISKLSNSKAQIHLRVPDYNFDERFKVR
jgi:hypothetical protein